MGPFCCTRLDVIRNSRSWLEAPQGVKIYRNVCPSVHSPTLPEWKYGNLESHALRVTCQIPFAGLCYVTNICHRLSQTPHLGVRNASPGRGRGLVRHQLLNQCEREDGVSPELLASLACTGRAERRWRGRSVVGDSRCYRVGLIPVLPPPSVSCLQRRPASGAPQWSEDMTLRPELRCCEQTDGSPGGVLGHLVCVTD